MDILGKIIRELLLAARIALLDLRTTRKSVLRVLIILACGMSSVVAILSLQQSMSEKLQENAKYILGADIAINVKRLFTEEEKKLWQQTIDNPQAKFSEEISLLVLVDREISEVHSQDKLPKNAIKTNPKNSISTSENSEDSQVNSALPRLFNVRAFSSSFPVYSKAEFLQQKNNTQAWSKLANHSLYLSSDQANRFGLQLGDHLSLGGGIFTVKDFIVQDAAMNLKFFSLFPTVYIGLEDLLNLKLLQKDSTLYHTLYASFPARSTINDRQLELLKKKLELTFKDPYVKVFLAGDSSDQTNKIWQTIGDFLGLLSLATLIMSVMGLLAHEKSQQVARGADYRILQLWGMTERIFLFFIFWQKLILALLAGILTWLFSYPLTFFLSHYLPDSFFSDSFLSIQIFGAATLFLWILQMLGFFVFHTKGRIFSGGLLIIVVLLFARWMMRSWILSGYLFLGVSTTFLAMSCLLYFPIYLVGERLRLTVPLSARSKMTKLRYFAFCEIPPYVQGLMRLLMKYWRHKFVVILIMGGTLATTLMLFLLLQAIQKTVTLQLTFDQQKPELFLFDIQPEDLDPLNKLIKQERAQLLSISPLVRGRILSINNVPLMREEQKKFSTREEEEAERFKFRSVNVTYRSQASPFEKIMKGDPLPSSWSLRQTGLIPVSLEYKYAQKLGVGIGDTLQFNVQGLELKARVVNLRQVFWLSLHPNFFIIFPAGLLENLTQSYLAVVKLPQSANMQNSATDHKAKIVPQGDTSPDNLIHEKELTHLLQLKFPHFSVVFLKEAVATLSMQISALLQALKLVLLSLGVLATFLWFMTVHDRMSQAQREIGLMRCLGISGSMINQYYLLEFSLILFFILLAIPLVTYGMALLMAEQFFEGVLVWHWSEIYGQCIVVILSGTILNQLIIHKFLKQTPKQLLSDGLS